MKVAIHTKRRSDTGLLSNELQFLIVQPDYDESLHKSFVGYIDLPIETPKKTVTKEAITIGNATPENFNKFYNVWHETYLIPQNAKNVKCTYDIEE